MSSPLLACFLIVWWKIRVIYAKLLSKTFRDMFIQKDLQTFAPWELPLQRKNGRELLNSCKKLWDFGRVQHPKHYIKTKKLFEFSLLKNKKNRISLCIWPFGGRCDAKQRSTKRSHSHKYHIFIFHQKVPFNKPLTFVWCAREKASIKVTWCKFFQDSERIDSWALCRNVEIL